MSGYSVFAIRQTSGERSAHGIIISDSRLWAAHLTYTSGVSRLFGTPPRPTADIPDVSAATSTRFCVCRCTGRTLMHLPSSGSRKSAISPFITSGRMLAATP